MDNTINTGKGGKFTKIGNKLRNYRNARNSVELYVLRNNTNGENRCESKIETKYAQYSTTNLLNLTWFTSVFYFSSQQYLLTLVFTLNSYLINNHYTFQ